MEQGGAGTFAQTLAALKRRGCGLLVVGMAPDAHVDVCRRLLGDAVAKPRRRLVVLAGGTAGIEERVPKAGSEGVIRVIDRRGPTRSAATTVASPSALDLQTLAADVDEALVELAPDDRSFTPAELRVCLDSVGPLLDAHGTDAVQSFLGETCDRVRTRDGMFQAHLPLSCDSDCVTALADPFDAVVEVRPGEQRWHLSDEEITTDWLPL